MVGILVILAVSWALLHFVQKTNLNALGFTPVGKRLFEIALGFLVLGIVQVSFVVDEAWITNATWEWKQELSIGLLFDAFKYHLISALTEDLVFRGAILFILFQRLGAKKGMWISAIVFGVYHVFSYGMIESGQLLGIVIVILMTGFMGYAWAYVFYKTKSIAMGLGMHWGWNMMQSFFKEGEPYGELLVTITNQTSIGDWWSLVFTLVYSTVPPLVCIWFVRLYTKKQQVVENE